MKTSIRSFSYLTVAGVVLTLTGNPLAQASIPSAGNMQPQEQTGNLETPNPLDKVSKLYAGYKTIQADFSFRYYRNEEDQTGQGEQGKLWLDAASGAYQISTPAQELISDGKSQWAVLKEADEVQITDVEAHEGGISPTNIFTFFRKGYNHKVLPDQQRGSIKLTVVELTPQDSRQNFSKILVRVNKASNQLYDVTVYDKNKSRYSYQIQQLKANQPIAEGQFVFDKAKYPGMEIVDLR